MKRSDLPDSWTSEQALAARLISNTILEIFGDLPEDKNRPILAFQVLGFVLGGLEASADGGDQEPGIDTLREAFVEARREGQKTFERILSELQEEDHDQ